MSAYTTAAEDAAKIRAAYKRRGWTSRDVSVRAKNFSGGSAVDVTIKSPAVDAPEAERIARGAESVARCEATGEILSGGNRYISVKHSRECKAILARRHLDALREALVSLPDEYTSRLEQVEGTDGRAWVGRPRPGAASLWVDNDHIAEFYAGQAEHAAFRLALAL